jgi:hypothetical protein
MYSTMIVDDELSRPRPRRRETRAPGPWAAEHVCHLIVMARRSLLGRAFLVMGGDPGRVEGVLTAGAGRTDQPMPPGVLKVLHWVNRLVTDRTEIAMLREYLRFHTGAAQGHSLSDLIRGHGWRLRDFHRSRERICRRIANDLNRRGVPIFDMTAQGEVRPFVPTRLTQVKAA